MSYFPRKLPNTHKHSVYYTDMTSRRFLTIC
uniref:Uncharacterized protein n=1 Tax=Anguilla anguilla TaxID=7936 RepID=A0A0E9VFE9_ANGAN